ncbi:MAG: thioredoxin domain-containing protein [Nitrospirae bacterium]|nr:thioredoxin domain-containing protein [Candidatus Manganitrophaceae bacterium]
MLDDTIQKTVMTKDDWTLGAPDARVTMLEYGDFECPYCGMARPVLESLVEEEPDTVRLVFRNFPLTNIHPHALMAAEAAEAAGAQGQFWEMHDMLFDHQDALEYDHIVAYAAALGLDVERFDRELRGEVYREKVREDFRRGIQDGVNGTPTIFMNRIRYDGPRDRVSMRAAIAAILSAEPSRRRAA